jgi:RIO-like serine/threonine protein kinase
MNFVNSDSLIGQIKKDITVGRFNCVLFDKALDVISGVDAFLQTKIHGDFAWEQCLINNGKIYFVDWELRNGIVTEDLVNYFRLDVKYFNRKDFNLIIKKYPNHVRKNLREYLILTELLRACGLIKILGSSKLENVLSFSKKRIKNILDYDF